MDEDGDKLVIELESEHGQHALKWGTLQKTEKQHKHDFIVFHHFFLNDY